MGHYDNVEQYDYRKLVIPTEEEFQAAREKYIEKYDTALKAFEEKSKFTKTDWGILFVAAGLQILRWWFMDNKKGRFANDKEAEKAWDKYVENTHDKLAESDYVPASIAQLVANFANHKVPYDVVARSERYKRIYEESVGLSGANHRYKTLGHDPLFGLYFGTANIATNTLTKNDIPLLSSYHVKNGEINARTDIFHINKWTFELLQEKPEIIGASLITQIAHYSTDVFTKQGLPLPMINVVSPEASKWLIGKGIDTYSVTRGAAFAIAINRLVEMFHRLWFNRNSDDEKLYDVRTKKILMYSNTLSSVINIGYVGATKDYTKLDVGGIAVALWKLFVNPRKIREIKYEFIHKTLDNELAKEEDEVNQRLAKWGFKI